MGSGSGKTEDVMARRDGILENGYKIQPASPNFRQYLTPEEFTARFAPLEQDYQAVKDFAKSKGLSTVPCGNPRAGNCV